MKGSRYVWFVFVVSVFSLAVDTPVVWASSQPKLAVTEIQARRGVDPTLAKVIEEYLVTEIAKIGKYSVIGRDDILRMLTLEEDKMKLTGCADDSCLAEIGGALGVDYMVGGSLDRVGKSILINLKVLDIKRAKVVARDGERLRGASEEDLLDAMNALFRRMFNKGNLVEKKKEQALAEEKEEQVLAGEKKEQVLVKEEKEQAGQEEEGGRLWTWVSGGIGVALAGLGAGLVGVSVQREDQAHSLADKADESNQVTYSEIKDKEDSASMLRKTGVVCMGVGAAGIVLGVVLFFVEGGGKDEHEIDQPGITAGPWLGDGVFGITSSLVF